MPMEEIRTEHAQLKDDLPMMAGYAVIPYRQAGETLDARHQKPGI
jgi:hypothetical protein